MTLRCNVSNPCTNINFKEVKTDGWRIGEKITGNVCEFASGSSVDTYPVMSCLDNSIENKENLVMSEYRMMSKRSK